MHHAAGGVRLLLLEPRHSAHAPLIERAAQVAGLSVEYVEHIEAMPPHAALMGVGPSVPEPLQVARRLRMLGAEPLLVFFTSSSAARDALRAKSSRTSSRSGMLSRKGDGCAAERARRGPARPGRPRASRTWQAWSPTPGTPSSPRMPPRA
jgi:hypothetical protein